MLSVKAVVIDYYLSRPIKELYNGGDCNRHWTEPVIRIFGPSTEGVKTCVNVHGVYPYMYVPYRGGGDPERDALLLGAALDRALSTGSTAKNPRFVHKVVPIRGIPLYGYHSRARQFFKIFFYNPHHIKKASDLLLSGAILGQKLQPHESHIPFTLQFMIDYNIYGMSFVTMNEFKFRRGDDHSDAPNEIDERLVLPSHVKRSSRSRWEVDVLAENIVNGKAAFQESQSVNPGLRAIWEDEKSRRRARGDTSQITPQLSESRGELPVTANEMMQRQRLAQKLRDAPIPSTTLPSDSDLSYPAEVSEDSTDFLEASFVAVAGPAPSEPFPEVENLIDEDILTRVTGGEGSESEGEETKIEDDSILGSYAKEEEEAEPEEEIGGDLTQPLRTSEDSGDEEPESEEEGHEIEDEFWKEMADKLMQLDGADDPASVDSDEENRKAMANVETDSVERILVDGTESIGNWSSNILSMLGENPGCPVPYQTTQTFWPGWSPKSNHSESLWNGQISGNCWSWDKGDSSILDCLSYPTKKSDDPSALNVDESVYRATDTLGYALQADYYHGSYTPASTMSPISTAGSVYNTISPPSAILTPSSEIDNYSDVNVDSVSQISSSPSPQEDGKAPDKTHLLKSKTVTLPRADIGRRSLSSSRQDLLEALKSLSGSHSENPGKQRTLSQTLKEYAKICGEILNVDLKNLSGKEMIVIEYKPSNSKSNQNRFVIKPLDRFLEDWESMEKSKGSWRKTGEDWPRLINGFVGSSGEEEKQLSSIINALENKYTGNWLDKSKTKTTKNKFIVKSIEMLPDGSEDSENSKKVKCDVEKSYKVNENLISDGKIKMRLIKDERKGKLDDEAKKMTPNNESVLKKKPNKSNFVGKVNKLSFADCRHLERKTKTEFASKEDKKLIQQINSSFEDYFKSIVKVNSPASKNEISDEECELEAEEDSSSGNEETESEGDAKSSDSIKFIMQLLSALSRSTRVPPLSITINLGRNSSSVQFNVRTGNAGGRKRKCKKLVIGNLDGAADEDSDSEDSGNGKVSVRTPGKKRSKKDSRVGNPDADGRKRKLSIGFGSSEEVLSSSFAGSSIDRRRGYPESGKDRVEKREREGESDLGATFSEQEGKIENLTKFGRNLRTSKLFAGFDETLKSGNLPQLSNEPDFIGDSDSETDLARKRLRKKRRKLLNRKRDRTKSHRKWNIPQTDVVSSSDGEGRRQKSEKGSRKVSESDETSKSKSSVANSPNPYGKEEEWNPPQKEERPCPESSGDVTDFALLSQVTQSRSCSGSSRTQTSKELFDISQEMSSVLERDRDTENVAVDSDGSLPREQPSDGEREITPFDLSGSLLLASKSSPSPSVRSGSSPFRKSTRECGGSSDFSCVLEGRKTIVPKRKPPGYRCVMRSLSDFGIPETIAPVPFYSDANDISKPLEVGGRILKIENYSIAGLKSHSTAVSLLGIEERRFRALNEVNVVGRGIRSAFVSKAPIVITPLSKAPTKREVISWKPEEPKVMEKNVSARMKMPKSPGQDSESDDELNLSITPTTSGIREGISESPLAGSSGSETSRFGSSPSLFGGKSSLSRRSLLRGTNRRKKSSRASKLQRIEEEEQPSVNKEKERRSGGSRSESSFEIRGVTLENTFGFKNSVEQLGKAKAAQGHELVTLLVLELHVRTRGSLRPDPATDPICGAFYTVTTDAPGEEIRIGAVVVGEGTLKGTAVASVATQCVPDEKALLKTFADLLLRYDPDILAGYEIEMNSWGYLLQRSQVLSTSLYFAIGRVISENQTWKEDEEEDKDDLPRYIRHLRISGRIVLDVWRLLRHEISLTSYTFENVMYHVMHERHPKHSYQLLTKAWDDPTRLHTHITFQYYLNRVGGVVNLLKNLDFVGRNSELARLFGIQFYEVLSRGSQFRVESMMLRLAKPLNYVPCSPSIEQRARMRAPASLPLIMEPESKFYADPVIVLDFQSLYPSMIIAYNYCFSTCLGRVEMLGGKDPFEFGCTHLQISPDELKKLEKDMNISPAGIAFVRQNVRKGILPSMLEEILETRLMVKKSMRENKEDKILQKVLHARQLGLKLIANVTYGYTAANFSGRMPCIEVGDSVVSKGRETLQRTIEMVNNNPRWGARVVYGDTDSLFVMTPGKSRKEAFAIGSEIAEAATRENPKPVKLKLEKVYQPCILQTKKRYVGYMYESPDQEEPVYDAKGIETVRRDGCPAIGKILQKALQILFEKKDFSLVKKYTVRQFAKIFQGRVNIQDMIFAKEYRGRKGYRPGACVPALQLAKQWTKTDRRAEPRVKERVPYVIVNGPPGVPLIRLVRSPHDLVLDPSLRINAVYYITKAIIPPLQRCFSLIGADVLSWYADMPRKYRKTLRMGCPADGRKRFTISQYFANVDCMICSTVAASPICDKCKCDTQTVSVILHDKIRSLEKRDRTARKICGSCCGRMTWNDCESLDCPVLFRRHQATKDLDQARIIRHLRDIHLS